jgi:hypothetical protein
MTNWKNWDKIREIEKSVEDAIEEQQRLRNLPFHKWVIDFIKRKLTKEQP